MRDILPGRAQELVVELGPCTGNGSLSPSDDAPEAKDQRHHLHRRQHRINVRNQQAHRGSMEEEVQQFLVQVPVKDALEEDGPFLSFAFQRTCGTEGGYHLGAIVG